MSTPSLKLDEISFDRKTPWTDDALERKMVADALTNLLDKETKPLVISLHGDWGTGKTFLLKRWHQQLENDKKKAIYFNAWEDDFLGDPLLAIFGQLRLALQGSSWQEVWNSVQKAWKPFAIKTTFGIIRQATLGCIDLDKESLSNTAEIAFDEYNELHKAKDELKRRLAMMAEKIAEDTGQPLIFIIDELDRCRPTFSIELLERVKHLLDIPNIVFVFGIDRNQLKSSIQAVYGSIDADGYLRRFFDMDFVLPPAKPDKFCECLIKRNGLEEHFKETKHHNALTEFSNLFPKLCKLAGLSLREIEHCIRVLLLAWKNSPDNESFFPRLLCIFLILRIKKPSLYTKLMQGRYFAAEAIDYFADFLQTDQYTSREFDLMDYAIDEVESFLYQTCITMHSIPDEEPVIQQLKLLKNGNQPTQPNLLAQRTIKQVSQKRCDRLLAICSQACDARRPEASRWHIRALGKKIELAEMMLGDQY